MELYIWTSISVLLLIGVLVLNITWIMDARYRRNMKRVEEVIYAPTVRVIRR